MQGIQKALGRGMHPGIDRIPAQFVIFGYVVHYSAGPGFLDDGEFESLALG